MMQPRRYKWRKQQRGRMRGVSTRGHTLAFGSFGLKALGHAWISDRQIEAARVAISRFLRREGKLWIRIFPDKPITKKPLEVRMGKGKGDLDHWAAVVKPGRILFEIDGVSMAEAQEAFRLASHKLPIPTKFVVRPDYQEGK
ncbi:MAG: 50S ribosomal protein L16 [Chlorobi bacterium]|nr:50S ribosomal protein L16 [Chlorobiota bacterium]